MRGAVLSQNKMTAIRALAEHVHDGRLDVGGFVGMTDEQLFAQLVDVPGIGPWSAQVFMLRCLRRPDVFPADDLGIRGGLMRLDKTPGITTPREAARRAAAWSLYPLLRGVLPVAAGESA